MVVGMGCGLSLNHAGACIFRDVFSLYRHNYTQLMSSEEAA